MSCLYVYFNFVFFDFPTFPITFLFSGHLTFPMTSFHKTWNPPEFYFPNAHLGLEPKNVEKMDPPKVCTQHFGTFTAAPLNRETKTGGSKRRGEIVFVLLIVLLIVFVFVKDQKSRPLRCKKSIVVF